MAISLKVPRRLSQRTQQEHCEGVASITTILILGQQLLSQEQQLLHPKRCGHKKETFYAGNLRQIGQIHALDLPQQTWDQQQIIHKRTCMQNKKNKAIKPQTKLLGRASDTIPSDNRTSASNDNKNYHFFRNLKIKRMLII